jgi:hypothetical protein
LVDAGGHTGFATDEGDVAAQKVIFAGFVGFAGADLGQHDAPISDFDAGFATAI